ncbi:YetF domain-containing protein [Texcoconibacillus texcoconensis]|uniref:Uncharacterized membrane protein YcaP (DUF421 family) n=1 Tax=Texcoconibacillus texcoconensis TaxID=1095777 RepID=A0A840QP74_9BACI|nr:uncharacterized membrane protein YcaP (DUF421 family) [Texcoconibacillus texcoconensis]
MVYGTIILRTVIIYIVILLVFRLMGKREIGQLSIVDFVVSIMIAELAVLSIENTEVSMARQLVPIILLMLIQISLAYVSLKSKKLRQLIDGKPSILIHRGKIDEEEMRKQRYNFDDLMAQLRQQQISDVDKVEFAILEASGELSVILKEGEGGWEDEEEHLLSYPFPLILDGEIQEDHVGNAGKSTLWLRQELRKLGYDDIGDISYCSLKRGNRLYIDINDRKK